MRWTEAMEYLWPLRCLPLTYSGNAPREQMAHAHVLTCVLLVPRAPSAMLAYHTPQPCSGLYGVLVQPQRPCHALTRQFAIFYGV